MKKILTLLFLFYVTISSAAEKNFVWPAFTGGSLESGCRAIWREYDELYGTNTVVISGISGLGGGMAINEMLKSTQENRFACMGIGQYLTNHLIYPGQTKESQLESIILTDRAPVIWYVPNHNVATNYKELLSYFRSLNRPINIGVFFPVLKYVGSVFEDHGIPVNIIPFRTGAQQYPSLSDGTLDLAFDVGPGVYVANETKKFRVIGYVESDNNAGLPGVNNFIWDEPSLAAMSSFASRIIAVPKSISNESKKQFSERLKKIVESERFKNVVSSFDGRASGATGPALQQQIESTRKILNKYWK